MSRVEGLSKRRAALEAESEQERAQFESALAEVTASLISVAPSALDAALDRLIAVVGAGQGLRHVRLFQHDGVGADMLLTHEWAADGRAPITLPLRVPFAKFPRAAEDMMAGRVLAVDDREQLGDDRAPLRRALEYLDARALLMVPLIVADRVLGALAFISPQPRSWPGTFLARAKLAAGMLATALERRRLDRQSAEQVAFERLITDLMGRFVDAPVDRIDAEITDALGRVCEALSLKRCSVGSLAWEAREGRMLYAGGGPGVLKPGDNVGFDAIETPDVLERIRKGETVVLTPRDVTPSEREQWKALGWSGGALVPIGIGGRVEGFFFLFAADLRAFGELFLMRARLLENLLAHALARKRSEEARARAFDELGQLKQRIERERDYLREEIGHAHGVHEIIATSPAMQQVLEAVAAVAPTDAAVLIRGETGVGKELIARAVHSQSARRDLPFVKVNCASIPRDLFESEFFGHVRGAFTGAHRDRQGRFELADRGTLFLDEVGEIPLDLQAKLLRVLQEGELERVGDDRTRRVDVRIVSATNRDLDRDVAEGRFRSDLFYRLGVFPIHVPPLRERREDIGPLAWHFLRLATARIGRVGLSVGHAELAQLGAYDWPGNIRELAHVIERAAILSREPPLKLELAQSVAASAPDERVLTAVELRELERRNVQAALDRAGGKIAGRGGAAELLKISPSTLRDRMRALGLRTTG